jgi:hypothetical protein
MNRPHFGVYGGEASATFVTEKDLLLDDIFQDFLDGDFGAFDMEPFFPNDDDDNCEKKKRKIAPTDGTDDMDKMERRYDLTSHHRVFS